MRNERSDVAQLVMLETQAEVRCFDLQTKANQKSAANFENRIETVWGDVRSPDDLALAVQDRDVVIHLAFIVDMLRSDEQPEWAWEINVDGMKNLLEARDAFVSPPSSPMDWVDSTESQKLLNYQKYSFEEYVWRVPASMGSSRYLVRLFGPLIRRSILNQSPFLKQNKQ